jgi:mannose-6-phosphate isomerase-like protein (cupin superfamily)
MYRQAKKFPSTFMRRRMTSLMWVEDVGDFTLEPGMIVRVPKGKKHKITNIVEELLVYDVFSPALI